MENTGYFFAAFIIIWALFFGCLLLIYKRQGRLRRDIDTLEETLKKINK